VENNGLIIYLNGLRLDQHLIHQLCV